MDCGDSFEIIGFGSITKLPAGAAANDYGALTTLAITNAIERANKSCEATKCPARLERIISITVIPNRGGLEALIEAKCTTGAKPLDPGGAYTAKCGATIEVTVAGTGDTVMAAEANAKSNAAAVAKKLCPEDCPAVEIPPPRIRVLQDKDDGMSDSQVLYTTKFKCKEKC